MKGQPIYAEMGHALRTRNVLWLTVSQNVNAISVYSGDKCKIQEQALTKKAFQIER